MRCWSWVAVAVVVVVMPVAAAVVVSLKVRCRLLPAGSTQSSSVKAVKDLGAPVIRWKAVRVGSHLFSEVRLGRRQTVVQGAQTRLGEVARVDQVPRRNLGRAERDCATDRAAMWIGAVAVAADLVRMVPTPIQQFHPEVETVE